MDYQNQSETRIETLVIINHRGRRVAGLTHSVVFGGGHRPDEEEEEEVVIGWQEKLFSQVSQYYLSSVYLPTPTAGDSCCETHFKKRLWSFYTFPCCVYLDLVV